MADAHFGLVLFFAMLFGLGVGFLLGQLFFERRRLEQRRALEQQLVARLSLVPVQPQQGQPLPATIFGRCDCPKCTARRKEWLQ